MEHIVAFLGRQPKISLAELESLYGASAIVRCLDAIAFLSLKPEEVQFNRIGGTSKMARILTRIDSTDIKTVERYLCQAAPEHAALHSGKLTIGISAYGLPYSTKQMQKLGLSLKTSLKKAGHSVRLVPNKQVQLSDAQVLHNKLHTKGWELCLLADGTSTIVAQTFAVQDLDAYTYRDRNRPARDARVGMLPPKLAQIIINLATAGSAQNLRLLDPFCGTGVVLIEALLMGYQPIGTDLEPRMVDYSRQNYTWALQKFAHDNIEQSVSIDIGDAQTHHWNKIDTVACETYLGEPYFTLPQRAQLEQNITEVNQLLRRSLKNLATQIAPGTRMCLAVPAWALKNGSFQHLPLLDSLEEIGYNRLDFVNAGKNDLLYHRPSQVVARELLVLERL